MSTYISRAARACLLVSIFSVLALLFGCGQETTSGLTSTDFNAGKDGKSVSGAATVLVTTDLIAGAGQGWPASGTDVGSVTVCQQGTKLKVTYKVDAGQGSIGEAHLDIGTVPAAFGEGVSFGLFPWNSGTLAAGTTTYTFTIPVSGNYPNVSNGYRKGSYNFSGAGSQLYVTAHCTVGGTSGGTPPTYEEVVVCDSRTQGTLGSFPITVGDANSSTTAGTLTVSLSGENLVFAVAAGAGTTFSSKSLQVSTSDNIAWPPSGWSYQDANGGTDSITVPLSSLNVPACGTACDAPSVPIYFAYYVETGSGAKGTAFSGACDDNFIAGQPTAPCRLAFADGDANGHVFMNLTQGPSDNDRGDAELWLDDNGDLFVKVTVSSGKLTETHLFIGTGIPTINAGSWTYHANNITGGSYTYGPIDLGQFGVSCGTGCIGTNLDKLNIAVHTVDEGQTSTGWGCGRRRFERKDWKSWDDCALTFECISEPPFFRDCGFIVPECKSHIEYIEIPGTPGTGGHETAMGLDKDNDGISANEPGWFEIMYGTVERWGWTFRSPRAI